MKLSTTLDIALGVFLGGLALDGAHYAITRLNPPTAPIAFARPSEPLPRQQPAIVPADRPRAPQPIPAKPCEVTNDQGERYSCDDPYHPQQSPRQP
jgi:hypothetical protein